MKRQNLLLAFVITAGVAFIVVGLVRFGPEGLRSSFAKWSSSLTSSASKPPPAVPVPVQLADICAQIRQSKDPSATRALIDKLRNLLNSLPHDVASGEIQMFLAGGDDASTDMDLTIGKGGVLGDFSSVRVFLLDYLGRIDPVAATTIAKNVLAHYTNPDEWAISLRNYAWANSSAQDRGYLQQKIGEMLANADWRNKPTTGYLEAFDAIVYAHDVQLTPQLSGFMLDRSNKAVSHAAFLTMDRLVLAEPKTMIQTFVEQPDLMKGYEKTRADFVARADLGNPDERALVEKYLLDPSRQPDEITTFAATYPNFNYMISNNLLTDNPTADRKTMVQRDRDALATVQAWQNDPRFSQLKPTLGQMQQRLEYFVQQADSSSP
jgi:hypothetical protein